MMSFYSCVAALPQLVSGIRPRIDIQGSGEKCQVVHHRALIDGLRQ